MRGKTHQKKKTKKRRKIHNRMSNVRKKITIVKVKYGEERYPRRGQTIMQTDRGGEARQRVRGNCIAVRERSSLRGELASGKGR